MQLIISRRSVKEICSETIDKSAICSQEMCETIKTSLNNEQNHSEY